MESKINDDNYLVLVTYDQDSALQPDVMLYPWTSPPGDTWETTDIWIDSPANGYNTYRYGTWNDALAELLPTLQAISAALQPFVSIKYLSDN